MADDQQKSIPKNPDSETSQALNAFAKALMVDMTWRMAGLLKAGKSTLKHQQPPHSEQQGDSHGL